MYHIILEFINLFLAGMLAGEEFVIYYGVRVATEALEGDNKPLGAVRFISLLGSGHCLCILFDIPGDTNGRKLIRFNVCLDTVGHSSNL